MWVQRLVVRLYLLDIAVRGGHRESCQLRRWAFDRVAQLKKREALLRGVRALGPEASSRKPLSAPLSLQGFTVYMSFTPSHGGAVSGGMERRSLPSASRRCPPPTVQPPEERGYERRNGTPTPCRTPQAHMHVATFVNKLVTHSRG